MQGRSHTALSWYCKLTQMPSNVAITQHCFWECLRGMTECQKLLSIYAGSEFYACSHPNRTIFTNISAITLTSYTAAKDNCSVDSFNPYPAVHNNPYLCKQCRSRSDGFFRSYLIRIYTVCHSVCEFERKHYMMWSDWLIVRNGCG